MNKILSSSDDETEEPLPEHSSKIVNQYLKEKRLSADEDPLVWWRQNANLYPELSQLARAFLACPPTSVASERLFSGAGLIYDAKRSRLAAERAEKLLFIKYNLPIIEFKY